MRTRLGSKKRKFLSAANKAPRPHRQYRKAEKAKLRTTSGCSVYHW